MIATGVIAATLVLGVIGTAAGLVWALDERSRANLAAEVAEQACDESDRERRAAEQQTDIAEAQLARSGEFRQFMAELLGSIKPDRRYPERSQAVRDLIDTAYDRLKSGDVKSAEARREVVELLAATASRLNFSARGAVGGEQATVGIGVIREGDYADTMHERMPIRLSAEWQRFSIPLDGLDLSTVRGGFVIESRLSDRPQTMYFDSISIE